MNEPCSNPRPRGLPASLASLCATTAFIASASLGSAADVTPARLLNAEQEPHNWLTYYGNYKGWRYPRAD